MAYANDRILATVTNKHTDTVAFYKEPALEVVESLRSLVGRVPMHKMLLGDEDDRIKEVLAFLAFTVRAIGSWDRPGGWLCTQH